jgi:hypothetical protein
MKRLPYARGIVHRSKNLFTKGFFFDRPLLLIQSDDWGRVGTRDQDGLEELKEAGLVPGENPYDFYSLETSDDVAMLAAMLQAHRDSVSRSPVLAMYFVVSNVDFENAAASGYQQIPMRSLSQGLPGRWRRPGLLQAYRAAVAQGTVYPALHGTTHFCRFAVQRELNSEGPRGELSRALWKSETPISFGACLGSAMSIGTLGADRRNATCPQMFSWPASVKRCVDSRRSLTRHRFRLVLPAIGRTATLTRRGDTVVLTWHKAAQTASLLRDSMITEY